MKLQALLSIAIAAVPAFAQTTPPPTCSTAPTSITALNLERTVTLTNIATTATPTIPANLQAAITGGALELRQQFSLNTTSNVITITDFAAQPSSTTPTLPGNILASNIVSLETFNVDKIYTSCKPTPSLLITGTISQNFPTSPVGSLVGVPAAISIGYTTDTPAKINNAVIVYSGIASVFSAAATGTLTFPVQPVTPPGSSTNNPVIVVGGGATQTTAQRQLSLDLSGSSSPVNSPITFTVTQVGSASGGTSGIPVAIGVNLINNSQILLTFPAGGRGDYFFMVTAIDAAGRSSTQIVKITYSGS